jgi:hypothetical protein
MQQQSTFNFGLTKNFFWNYRTLSMRQKTKIDQNQGSNVKKIFYGFVPKSPSQMGSLSAKTQAKYSHAWAPLNSSSLPFFQFFCLAGHEFELRQFSNTTSPSGRVGEGGRGTVLLVLFS